MIFRKRSSGNPTTRAPPPIPAQLTAPWSSLHESTSACHRVRVGHVGLGQVGDHDVRALALEHRRRGLPEPGAATRDDERRPEILTPEAGDFAN